MGRPVSKSFRPDSALLRRMKKRDLLPGEIADLLKLSDWCRLAAYSSMSGDTATSVARENVDWIKFRQFTTRKSARLLSHKGVQWVSYGYRTARGIWSDTPSIVVFVRKKWPVVARSALPASEVLPRFLRDERGRRVAVDVVEVGKLRQTAQLAVGDRIDPGLSYGTLGFFARERTSGGPVAVTAAHVLKEFKAGDTILVQERGSHQKRVLGVRLMSSPEADIVAVSAAGHQSVNALPGSPPLRGIRDVSPHDVGESFRSFGSTTAEVVNGVMESPGACGSNLPIRHPIVVRMPVSPGDSGALLVDTYNYAAGLLHGYCTADPGLAVFTPLKAGLSAIGCI